MTGDTDTGATPRPAEPAYRRPLLTRIQQFVLASSKDHAFLDRPYFGLVMALTPQRWKRPLANYILSLSPHYFLPNWEKKYPADWTREQKVEANGKEGLAYRRKVVDTLVLPHVSTESVMLDFGCGPGVIANMSAPHVGKVIAVDVSRGVIDISRALEHPANVEFVANRKDDLSFIPTGSLDLVFSFVVLQHLTPDQVQRFLQEFYRVLKPGAKTVFQIKLREEDQPRYNPGTGNWLHRRTMLRMVFYSRAQIRQLMLDNGFTQFSVTDLRDYEGFENEWDNGQIVIASKLA